MQYELYHHGILGMKWGIRRYQNEDGSLTEAGKRRLERAESAFGPGAKGKPSRVEKLANEAVSLPSNAKSIASSVYGLKRRPKYDLSSMSDEDLRKSINRMEMEKKYSALKESDTRNGEAKVNSILGIVGGVVGTAASAATIASIIWQITHGKSSGD